MPKHIHTSLYSVRRIPLRSTDTFDTGHSVSLAGKQRSIEPEWAMSNGSRYRAVLAATRRHVKTEEGVALTTE